MRISILRFVTTVTCIVLCSVPYQAQADSYTFTAIDVPAANSTFASGINNRGQIVGSYIDATGGHGFLEKAGTFRPINVPSEVPFDFGGLGFDTLASGINNRGQIVGTIDPGPLNLGFLRSTRGRGFHMDSSGIFTRIETPFFGGQVLAAPGGINDRGQIVGYYGDGSAVETQGFILSRGTYTSFTVPSGTVAIIQTLGSGINDRGQIVGSYIDATGRVHGFLEKAGIFTPIDVPFAGVTQTQAFGINDHGQIVGSYIDATGTHGFVEKAGTFTPIDVPFAGVTLTKASGINDRGQIVGSYIDATGTHGFLATSVNTSAVCSHARAFPAVLWSPNHQFVPIVVMGVRDPDGDVVTITVTGVTQDEPVLTLGSDTASSDAVIQAGAASVRAERLDSGNGRVYEMSFTAESKGGSCHSSVKVSVPHSLKKGLTAIDDGQVYDSTAP